MSRPDPRLSRAVTAHAVAVAGLSAAHSLRTRGLRRTLLFAGLANAIPAIAEYLAINPVGALRHHTRPRVGGVPLPIILGWYNLSYATFSVAESLLTGADSEGSRRRRSLPPVTALLATDLDLLLDPAGLGAGLWEWSGDGPYAEEIRGSNGRRGIPLFNFAGWLAIESSIALAYRFLEPDDGATGERRPGEVGSPEAGRAAALLLLLYYLPAAAWASKRRGWKYLLYSAPFSTALLLALKGRSPDR
jgi:uncharacterized membrane protein